jgi:hypothetical protein
MFKWFWWSMAGLLLFCVPSPVAVGQSLDRVVVSGVRIGPDDEWSSRDKPHITKRVRADLILMEVSVVSGTIDRTEREQELRAMFDRMIEAVDANSGMEVEAGTFEDRFAIETTRVSDIWNHYGNRGSFSLVLQVGAAPNERFEDVQERGEDFLYDLELVGRAQVDVGDEQYIGLRDIVAHRIDLLRAINADIEELQEIFSASEIDVAGLESAIVTQPVDEMVLELYIPYTVGLAKE